MADFCERNSIKQTHGNPRTPITQGLVERNNKTIKENMSNILKEKGKNNQTWCTILNEAAYKKNITVHSATKKTPYEIVFCIKPNKEIHKQEEEKQINLLDSTEIVTPNTPAATKRTHSEDEIFQNQSKYNHRMKKQRKKPASFSIGEHVAIKINKVDKKSPLHPNVLIGKITEVQNDYVKLVTKFGIINTSISTNRLDKCSETNIDFDYSKQIAFSKACKLAETQ